MFVELHYQGFIYSYNVEKIVRYFAKGSNTHIVFDSTTGFEGVLVDEDYDTVKSLIEEAINKYFYPYYSDDNDD